MEEIKNSQLAIIENGSYQKIENLLAQLDSIDDATLKDDILFSLNKRKDICLKLIENEKLPEVTLEGFIKDCSFEEFLLILSRSDEYLTFGNLCSCSYRKEYLQQIVQSNNIENILRISLIPNLPLNIQIYILTSGNDELIHSFLKSHDEFADLIEKIIIFSKNKKWYQWAVEDKNCKMYVEPDDKLEDDIITSDDEEIISFAIDVCLFDNPLKIIELNNPRLTEKLVRSFAYEKVTDWISKNKREDLLAIMIEEHFLNEKLPETLLKFQKHKFMFQYIQKLQHYAASEQIENQEECKFVNVKGLEQILKYYEVPYKHIGTEHISLILE